MMKLVVQLAVFLVLFLAFIYKFCYFMSYAPPSTSVNALRNNNDRLVLSLNSNETDVLPLLLYLRVQKNSEK